MFRREVASHLEAAAVEHAAFSQSSVGFTQEVEALLRRHPAKEPDGKRTRRPTLRPFKPSQRDAEGHNVNLLSWNAEVLAHVTCVGLTDGKKCIHMLHLAAHEFQHARPILLEQPIDKNVFAL